MFALLNTEDLKRVYDMCDDYIERFDSNEEFKEFSMSNKDADILRQNFKNTIGSDGKKTKRTKFSRIFIKAEEVKQSINDMEEESKDESEEVVLMQLRL